MKPIFSRNIDTKGRFMRGIGAGATVRRRVRLESVQVLRWVLLASGLFLAFEALRGWCALQVCGIRTKL